MRKTFSSSSLIASIAVMTIISSVVPVRADIHIAYPSLLWLTSGDDLFTNARDSMYAAINEYNSVGGLHNGTQPIVVHEYNASRHNDTMTAIDANPDIVTIFAWYLVRVQRETVTPWLQQQNLLILGSENDDPTALDGQLNYVSPWASIDFQIFGIANYAVAVRKFKRICTLNVDYAGSNQEFSAVAIETERATLKRAMSQLDRELTCEIVLPSHDVDPAYLDSAAGLAISSISEHNPQAIIVLGLVDEEVAAFFATTVLVPLNLDPDFTFLGSSFLLTAFRTTLQVLNVTELGTRVNVVTISSSPGLSRPDLRLVQKFTESYDALYGVGNMTGRNSDALAAYHMAKWFLSLLDGSPSLTREGIRKHLYANTIVSVEDIIHGVYSDQTTTDIVLPIGQCNRGGKEVYYARLLNNLSVTDVDARFQMSATRCTPTGDEVRRPVFTPTLTRLCSSSTDPRVTDLNRLSKMTLAGAHDLLYTKLPFVEVLSECTKTFSNFYKDYLANYVVTALVAPEVDSTLSELPTDADTADASWTAYIDPIPPVPELSSSRLRGDTVHFIPSLDQQLFAFGQYIAQDSSASSTSTALLMHQDVSSSVEGAADQTAFTSKISISHSRFSRSSLTTADLTGASSGKSFLIVLGLSSTTEAQTLADFISSTSDIQVFLEYKEYTRHFSTLATTLTASNSLGRLLVASSFPSPAGNSSDIEKNFHNYLEQSGFSAASGDATPMALQGYVTGRIIKTVLERMNRGTGPEQFMSTLYNVAVIGTESGFQFGPFSNSSSSACSSGARAVSIYPLSAQVYSTSSSTSSSSPSYTYTFSDCTIAYEFEQKNTLSPAIVAMIAILGVLFLVLVLVIIFFLVSKGDVRDTSTAPKDDSKPFAVMFTDIQASTMLWSRLPSDMGTALDNHHKIIRELIKKHNAYEVKTIGDAFLIVHSDANALVSLAEDLQENFLNHNWGTEAFDSTYKEAEQEAYENAMNASMNAKKIEAAEPPTLNDPAYSSKWSGLRVRVGVHFGSGDITFDKVSKGYDYYGTVVNTASRVESSANGGQVIVSAAVLNQLKSAPPEKFKNMGAHALRGVQEPTELFQLEFRDRKYKQLNTLTTSADEGDGDGEDHIDVELASHQSSQSIAASQVSSGAIAKKYLNNIASQRVKMEMSHGHSYLSLLLSSTPDTERKDLVQKLAERWRVDSSMLSRKGLSTKLAVDWGIWSLTERVTKVHMETQKSKEHNGERAPLYDDDRRQSSLSALGDEVSNNSGIKRINRPMADDNASNKSGQKYLQGRQKSDDHNGKEDTTPGSPADPPGTVVSSSES